MDLEEEIIHLFISEKYKKILELVKDKGLQIYNYKKFDLSPKALSAITHSLLQEKEYSIMINYGDAFLENVMRKNKSNVFVNDVKLIYLDLMYSSINLNKEFRAYYYYSKFKQNKLSEIAIESVFHEIERKIVIKFINLFNWSLLILGGIKFFANEHETSIYYTIFLMLLFMQLILSYYQHDQFIKFYSSLLRKFIEKVGVFII